MSVAARFTEIATDAARVVSEWFVGKAYVFYQAGFRDENIEPLIDQYHLGPLQVNRSINLDPYSGPVSAVLVPAGPTAPNGGMRLTVSKPAGFDDAHPGEFITGGLVVLNPQPPDAEVVLISATFLQPRGPHTKNDSWASVVGIREGGVPNPADKTKGVQVTLQATFRDDPFPRPGGRVNTPGGTQIPAEIGFLPDTVYEELFEKPPFHDGDIVVDYSIFTLDLRITRWFEPARASVTTHSYSNYRLVMHPELATTEKLTAGGVNIAIARGSGPAAVTVRDFRLIGLRAVPWTTFPIINTVGAALMRVPFVRRLRSWLVDLALSGARRVVQKG